MREFEYPDTMDTHEDEMKNLIKSCYALMVLQTGWYKAFPFELLTTGAMVRNS